jgi:hypothetical protein
MMWYRHDSITDEVDLANLDLKHQRYNKNKWLGTYERIIKDS